MPTQAAHRVFLVLLSVAVALFVALGLPLWKPLLLAAVLAGALSRKHEALVGHLGGRRYVSAAIMTVAVFVLVLIPVGGLAAFVAIEVIEAAEFISETLRRGGMAELIDQLPQPLHDWATRLAAALPEDLGELSDGAAASGRWAAATLADILGRTSQLLFDLAMLFIALFFFLVDGHALVRWIRDALPLMGRQTTEMLREFRAMALSVLGSSLITGGAQAAVATVGYVIAPVPQPLFFGLVTFFTSFIPSVGTALVSVPLTVFLFLSGRVWWGVFLAAWSIALVALVDNVLRPWIIRGQARLHGAVVFFSLIGGIALVGPIGLVVGPLALTFLLTMVRMWQRDFSPEAQLPPPVIVPPAVAAPSGGDEDERVIVPPPSPPASS